MYPMTAAGYLEIRNVRRATHYKLVHRALKSSLRRKCPCNAAEHSELCLLIRVGSGKRSQLRILSLPWPQAETGLHHARRDRIESFYLAGHYPPSSQIVYGQLAHLKAQGRFSRYTGGDVQDGAVSQDLADRGF